jgi:hypothetical protein
VLTDRKPEFKYEVFMDEKFDGIRIKFGYSPCHLSTRSVKRDCKNHYKVPETMTLQNHRCASSAAI